VKGQKPCSPQRSLRQRVEAGLLLTAILVGCQVLWLAVPALSLWGLSRLVSAAPGYLLVSLVSIPSALAAFAWLLGLANRRYLSISRPPAADDEDLPRLHGPLESIMPASVMLAVVALLVWIVVFADHISLALE
jgi:hypothetical protein